MTKKILRTLEEKRSIHAARMRAWRRHSPKKAAAIMKRFRKNHPKTIEQKAFDAAYQREWRSKNLNKKQAVQYANYYLKAGSTEAILSNSPNVGTVCELCPEDDKRTENLEKHHPNYEYALIVVTVCKECHEIVEKELITEVEICQT